MEQAIMRFCAYVHRQFGSSSTLKHYRSDLKIFLEVMGPRAAKDITAKDIDHFVEAQLGAGLKPSTINRRLACICSLFDYLAREDVSVRWPNPVIWQRHHLKTGSHLPRDLSEADVSRLLSVITDVRDKAIVGLMLGAGLRVGEVVSMQLAHLEPATQPGQFKKLRVIGKGNKERMVWLPGPISHLIQNWLDVRPACTHQYVFVNQHGGPLSVSGVQYRLKQYAKAAGIKVSCHQLRHTFARRLVEQGMPVESLSRLLGHSHLSTTQVYIDGADPTVRADFVQAMSQMGPPEGEIRHEKPPIPPFSPQIGSRKPSAADLSKLRGQLDTLPDWLGQVLDSYLIWRWPTWKGQTAYDLGYRLLLHIRRIWCWLDSHRQVAGWESFRRADLEAWVQARGQDDIKPTTVENELMHLRMLLRFAAVRDYPVDPDLLRVKAPRVKSRRLPRYLSEQDYRRLESFMLEQTQKATYIAAMDRAWFLMMAHTGIRISEVLDTRLGDLNLEARSITIRGSKHDHDRVVFITPALHAALLRFLNLRHPVPDDDHLFVGCRSKTSLTANYLRRRLTAYAKQINLHVTPHKLRHTFATRLINRGMPIHSLRKLLGHRKLDTTQIYAHLYDETLHDQFQTAMHAIQGIPVDTWPKLTPAQIEEMNLDDSV